MDNHNTNQNSTHNTIGRPAPRFYVWDQEILYLGTSPSQPAPHKVIHDKLIISLAGYLRLSVNGHLIRTRSCLVTTGQWHDRTIVDCSEAVAATWLLSPFSQDVPALARVMRRAGDGLYYGHPNEDTLAHQLRGTAGRPDAFGDCQRQALRMALLPEDVRFQVFRTVDPRVLDVARRIRQTVNLNLPVGQLAREVGLSGSYLEKLFKAHSGLPITRFRLRYRTYVSAVLLGMGYSITDAALKAGFSSSSHFSRTHRALTGETASDLFIRSGVESVIERQVIRSVLKVIRGTSATGSGEIRANGSPGEKGTGPRTGSRERHQDDDSSGSVSRAQRSQSSSAEIPLSNT